MSCFWGHKWSKWTQYNQNALAVYHWGKLAGQKIEIVRTMQSRDCDECGKREEEEV